MQTLVRFKGCGKALSIPKPIPQTLIPTQTLNPEMFVQEYYANTGALRRAAETAKGKTGGKVGCSIVETFGKDVKPRELEEVLRLEYRSKLLNPKWAKVGF